MDVDGSSYPTEVDRCSCFNFLHNILYSTELDSQSWPTNYIYFVFFFIEMIDRYENK